VEERLDRLEQAIIALRMENQQLRTEVGSLKRKIYAAAEQQAEVADLEPPRFKSRWAFVGLSVLVVALPVVALTVWNMNAFWSTTIGAVNGILLYLIGPGILRLLIEGLFRAIPGVLFGQATRIAVDKYRQRKAR
jgi:hypothetical protein